MNSPEDHCPSPLRSVLLLHDDIHSWSLVVCHSRSVACHACRRQASKVGGFVTWHEGQPVLHELQAGDGLLIHSERMHNVAPVTRGVRHSLVIELWVAPDNKLDRFS